MLAGGIIVYMYGGHKGILLVTVPTPVLLFREFTKRRDANIYIYIYIVYEIRGTLLGSFLREFYYSVYPKP